MSGSPDPDGPTDPNDWLRADPRLGPAVERHGPVALEPADAPFERFVVSIVNQQLSTQSAAAIVDRLFDRFEVTPETMLAAETEALRDVGLSGQKVEYVRNVARAFQDGQVSRERYATMDDDSVVSDLTGIRGVGDWTAKMFCIFVLAREDVFPVEDLGIRRGMEAVFEADLTRGEMTERAEAWRPYRSYASLYLWRVTDGDG